jgi:hypothetical protein
MPYVAGRWRTMSAKGGGMTDKTKSTTEKETNLAERIFGGEHYKTTISDGKDKAEARGSTPDQSQKLASERWDHKKDK